MSDIVTVRENGLGRYQQAIRVGQHGLIADEPVAVGGGDAGPAPFDFVLAGLGACTSMTLRMYAERKAWPLTGIEVTLRHDRVDTADGPRERICRSIALSGELSAEQRARLLEIANKCPVHRALSQSFVLDCALAT